MQVCVRVCVCKIYHIISSSGCISGGASSSGSGSGSDCGGIFTCMRLILPVSVSTEASSLCVLQHLYALSNILNIICSALCCLEQIHENNSAEASGPWTELGS